MIGAGGRVGQKPKKRMPQEIINKIYIFLKILAKQNAPGGSAQLRLLQINYEVNAKSRLEKKRDFVFSLNKTHE